MQHRFFKRICALALAVLTALACTACGEATMPTGNLGSTTIELVFGGDVKITPTTVAAGKTDSGYDYSPVFLDVAHLLAQADAAVLNFEGTVGAGEQEAPPALVKALDNMGVDFLQTANSCSVQSGISGLRSTLDAIRAAGMEPVGTFADSADFRRQQGFTIRQIGGIRVAFVAFTKGMGGMGLPAGSEKCVNLLYTDYTSTYHKINTSGINSVLAAVEAAQPDITIALVHWGSEDNTTVSPTQEKIKKLLLSGGVDAIIGSHSHQLQQIEYDGEAGTLVAYSLGDFFGDGTASGSYYSLLLTLSVTRDNQTGETRLSGWDYTPIYTVMPERDGLPMQVLRLENAISMYENQYITDISEATYKNMKLALEKIAQRITPSE